MLPASMAVALAFGPWAGAGLAAWAFRSRASAGLSDCGCGLKSLGCFPALGLWLSALGPVAASLAGASGTALTGCAGKPFGGTWLSTALKCV